ncbi:MAG: hypothetical protein R3321_11495 [Nitrososphaeraceae archaeon]|nr:hypothetical protein [Nitrososphaeraceae archaeon]
MKTLQKAANRFNQIEFFLYDIIINVDFNKFKNKKENKAFNFKVTFSDEFSYEKSPQSLGYNYELINNKETDFSASMTKVVKNYESGYIDKVNLVDTFHFMLKCVFPNSEIKFKHNLYISFSYNYDLNGVQLILGVK